MHRTRNQGLQLKFQGRSPKFKDFSRTNSFSWTFQGLWEPCAITLTTKHWPSPLQLTRGTLSSHGRAGFTSYRPDTIVISYWPVSDPITLTTKHWPSPLQLTRGTLSSHGRAGFTSYRPDTIVISYWPVSDAITLTTKHWPSPLQLTRGTLSSHGSAGFTSYETNNGI